MLPRTAFYDVASAKKLGWISMEAPELPGEIFCSERSTSSSL